MLNLLETVAISCCDGVLIHPYLLWPSLFPGARAEEAFEEAKCPQALDA